MAITTMDGIANGLANGQGKQFYIPSAAAASGGFVCLNQNASANSFGPLATPTAFGSGGTTYAQSSLSAGSIKYSNPTGGNTMYLAMATASSSIAGNLYIYDILWACSGFSGTSTSAQSVVSFSGMPTRNTTGDGCELWIGCSSALGATASNITASYTNQANTSGQTSQSVAMIASMPAQRMLNLPLQAGDTGIRSLASVTLSASTGTAGNFWAMILQPIALIPIPAANFATNQDFAALALPQIAADTTFLFVSSPSSTTTGNVQGRVSLIQG